MVAQPFTCGPGPLDDCVPLVVGADALVDTTLDRLRQVELQSVATLDRLWVPPLIVFAPVSDNVLVNWNAHEPSTLDVYLAKKIVNAECTPHGGAWVFPRARKTFTIFWSACLSKVHLVSLLKVSIPSVPGSAQTHGCSAFGEQLADFSPPQDSNSKSLLLFLNRSLCSWQRSDPWL
jgi:hypothetical protein